MTKLKTLKDFKEAFDNRVISKYKLKNEGNEYLQLIQFKGNSQYIKIGEEYLDVEGFIRHFFNIKKKEEE